MLSSKHKQRIHYQDIPSSRDLGMISNASCSFFTDVVLQTILAVIRVRFSFQRNVEPRMCIEPK